MLVPENSGSNPDMNVCSLQGPKGILSCALAEICAIHQSVSAPRAIGLSTFNPGRLHRYSSVVLLSKIPQICACWRERITDAV